MTNNELIRQRLEKIKQMDDTREALSALADIQYELDVSAYAERHELQKELDTLRRAMIGNGNPENSLIARMTRVESFMKNLNGDVRMIKDALLGTLVDGKKVPGFIDRLNNAEKINKTFMRIAWLLVTVVLTEITLKLIGLF